MASIKYIVKHDKPVAVEVEGSILDTVAMITYLINDCYSILTNTDPKAGEAFRKMLAQLVGDTTSPVWQQRTVNGTAIRLHVPKKDKGDG